MKNKILKYTARTLRKAMTCHEQILWHNLCKKKILGCQFYRQKIIAGYIVDFYCATGKLVVELDGSQHKQNDAIAYDAERTRVLISLGWTVIRVDDLPVETHLDKVLAEITKHLECISKAIPPNLPSKEGRSNASF